VTAIARSHTKFNQGKAISYQAIWLPCTAPKTPAASFERPCLLPVYGMQTFITPNASSIDCMSISGGPDLHLTNNPQRMAAIKNLNGLSPEQFNQEIARGGRLVMYQYTISLIVVTLQRSSDIHFIPAHENGVATGLPYTVLSLILGWWGLPWGPIRTIKSIACNLSGGRDITQELMGLMDMDNTKASARKVA
jgi:hypothetical protein